LIAAGFYDDKLLGYSINLAVCINFLEDQGHHVAYVGNWSNAKNLRKKDNRPSAVEQPDQCLCGGEDEIVW
jgi:hypothetical protein